MVLNNRCSDLSVPSRYKTVSTICSKTRGPATSPDFVTCPTNSTIIPTAQGTVHGFESTKNRWKA